MDPKCLLMGSMLQASRSKNLCTGMKLKAGGAHGMLSPSLRGVSGFQESGAEGSGRGMAGDWK